MTRRWFPTKILVVQNCCLRERRCHNGKELTDLPPLCPMGLHQAHNIFTGIPTVGRVFFRKSCQIVNVLTAWLSTCFSLVLLPWSSEKEESDNKYRTQLLYLQVWWYLEGREEVDFFPLDWAPWKLLTIHHVCLFLVWRVRLAFLEMGDQTSNPTTSYLIQPQYTPTKSRICLIEITYIMPQCWPQTKKFFDPIVLFPHWSAAQFIGAYSVN